MIDPGPVPVSDQTVDQLPAGTEPAGLLNREDAVLCLKQRGNFLGELQSCFHAITMVTGWPPASRSAIVVLGRVHLRLSSR